ncbi:MAG TPA: indole-3-glycerol phosphate synthase TrpC [Gemmatimonadota bacterium]|nr:indole-3-glycerol phosphate synthase TrpC [Gemmatimonadota bacterium]
MPKVNTAFLSRAVERKRTEVARLRAEHPEADLRARAAGRPPARDWPAALRGGAPAVIAEFKRRSPSAGALDPGADPAARAALYEGAGAAAVSILTDSAFDGTLADLTAAAGAVGVPVLRKDFLVDPWQVWESRAAGADAALVVLAAVGDPDLGRILEASAAAGLGLLVEIHGLEEIPRVERLGAAVVGVNARDLGTLRTSPEGGRAVLEAVRGALDPTTLLVAESGIAGPDDVRRARAAGADAVLVGEYLMRAGDPAAALGALVGAAGPAGESRPT